MNVSRQLFRQAVRLANSSNVMLSSRLLSTVSLRQERSLHGLRPTILQICNSLQQSINSRQTSTAQSCKFEVINVQDEDDFKKRVLESERPVIVDFHAQWCGPCRLLGPRLEKLLSEENGKVIMAKVDIDDNSDLAMEYGVRSVPTVLGMKDGKVQSQFVGLIDDDQIQTFVDKLVVS